jgi:hypothetical protein
MKGENTPFDTSCIRKLVEPLTLSGAKLTVCVMVGRMHLSGTRPRHPSVMVTPDREHWLPSEQLQRLARPEGARHDIAKIDRAIHALGLNVAQHCFKGDNISMDIGNHSDTHISIILMSLDIAKTSATVLCSIK